MHMTKEYHFNPGDYVVYPTHGVGRVTEITNTQLAGQSLDLIAVEFGKENMVMRIPMTNVGSTKLRHLSSKDIMNKAIKSLSGRPVRKKMMWTRRAQEYEAKINSGDPCLIAEVVRDLNKPTDKGEQSYSERQVFEHAFDRLVCEYAACEGIDEEEAKSKLNSILKGSSSTVTMDVSSQSL